MVADAHSRHHGIGGDPTSFSDISITLLEIPEGQKLSYEQWQELVDKTCAQAVDAARMLFHANAKSAVTSSDLTQANDSEDDWNDGLDADNQTGEARVSRREQGDAKFLAKASSIWKVARKNLSILLERLKKETERAESSRISTNSKHFEPHLEKAVILHEAEAGIFRGFHAQLEECLALTEDIAAGRDGSAISKGLTPGQRHPSRPQQTGPNASAPHMVHVTGTLRFETYNGDQLVVSGVLQARPALDQSGGDTGRAE